MKPSELLDVRPSGHQHMNVTDSWKSCSVSAVCLVLLTGPASAADYFLTIGGGYVREQNQASLEANVLFFRTVLAEQCQTPVQHEIFFADGTDPTADLQVVRPEANSSGELSLRELISGLHRRGPPAQRQSVEYRNHQIPEVAGKTSPELIRASLSRLARKIRPDDRLLIYVTAHGSEGSRNQRRNTTISCWGNQSISVQEFSAWLDEIPSETPVILVMAQCYCGGFADTIFKDPADRTSLSAAARVGFFAQQYDLPAAGCRPDIEHDQEFSSYFWGTIAGRSRNGEPLTGADADGNGRISFEEAFANAVIIGDTIDIPIRSSEVLLHEFSRIPDYVLFRNRTPRRPPRKSETEDQNSAGSGSIEHRGAASEDSPTPNIDDSALPGRMSGNLESALETSRPATQRIVSELCRQLNLSRDVSLDEIQVRYEAHRRNRPAGFGGPGRGRSGRRELLSAIEEHWPELADAENWRESSLLAETDAESVLKEIRELPEFEVYEQRRRERERMAAAAESHELKSVKYRRLIDTLENLLLARNLPLVASPDIVARYRKIIAIEEMSLRAN